MSSEALNAVIRGWWLVIREEPAQAGMEAGKQADREASRQGSRDAWRQGSREGRAGARRSRGPFSELSMRVHCLASKLAQCRTRKWCTEGQDWYKDQDPYILSGFPGGLGRAIKRLGRRDGKFGGGGTSPVELAAFARHVSYFAAIQSLTPSWD